ncbi:3',5'-cyclic adenosine monophosphate phosphodiesterase CpdA [Pseudomonas savastanoi pv. phaseolicola]|uniref:phosphodiesterase n=1 Tax=Pseudomonas savastanoi TaxID=29438 RepID=UPI0006B8E6F2|nr:phosphodiesterase [Pseudomonas savastanoi]KPB42843.1 3',5'-cyclic adenosine monophosphate phosphodiesterase CpdA [Pseudomonas savastanoi pv. phaseolicola]RMV39521.1 3',5'-cyclic adenosine monophosphate phosphodiesterase CpdA [Pseudomonas savastanoi pv. phaseolicola]
MLIAHISDTHVRPRGLLYQGVVDSNAMLAAAVDTINALDPAPDLILFSGDLVDEGRPEEYAMARELLQPLRQRLLMIPGNHDHRQNLRSAFPEHDYFINEENCSFVDSGSAPMRIIGLDISVPDQHHGDMTDTATQWLARTLALEPDKPTLIMMHQPPFSSGIHCIDAYRCERGERLAEVVSRYPAVERIVCGHIHRFMQLRFGGTLMCTAPSTTTAIVLQLRPDAADASYVEPPALLLHHWKADTGLITHWVPIGRFEGPFDFA